MNKYSLAALLACSMLATSAFAAGWTGGGPFGGYVYSISRSPSNQSIVYAGTRDGVYKSTNDGADWTRKGPGNAMIYSVAAFSSNLAYAATNDGVVKTSDGGTTWYDAGLENIAINGLAVHPTNSQVVLAGVGDPALAASADTKGIFRTTDGGSHWTQVYSKDVSCVNCIRFDVDNPQRIYAGAQPLTVLNPMFLRSSDGGATWTGKTGFSGTALTGFTSTAEGDDNAAVYALTTNKLYKSVNQGDTWTDLNTTYVSGQAAVAVDSTEPTRMFLSTSHAQGNFYRSTTSGSAWTKTGSGYPPIGATVLDVNNSNSSLLMAVDGGGIYRSTSHGTSWEASNDGMDDALVAGLAVHPSYSQRVLASVSGGYIYQTWNAGSTWTELDGSLYGGGVLTIDPNYTNTLYLGDGNTLYKSYNLGSTWGTGVTFPKATTGTDTPVIQELLINADNSNRILAAVSGTASSTAGGGIYLSINAGATWTKKSSWWKVPALAADPANPSIVYSGTAQGGYIDRSSDGGNTWNPISPDDEWVIAVWDIAVGSGGTVYAATTDGLIKWTGTGTNWVKFTGLPADDVRAIVIDTRLDADVLFASVMNHGVYVSDDLGATWDPLNTGLDSTKVVKLALSDSTPTYLYGASYDRGVWSIKSPYQPDPVNPPDPGTGCNGTAATITKSADHTSTPPLIIAMIILLAFGFAAGKTRRTQLN